MTQLLFRFARRVFQALWGGPARHPYRRLLYRSLCVEELEGRTLLSTFTVLNINDSGPGSLRQAILDANAAPGLDTILFAIGSGQQTIKPTSALPTITDRVIIDATTQPGFTNKPIIVLDGSSAGAGANGLTITAGNSTVRGLVIDQFGANGILLNGGTGNVITGNYVGTDVTGMLARPNGNDGIVLSGASNTVGGTVAGAGNVISGNAQEGIAIISSPSSFLVSENNIELQVDSQTGNILATYSTGVASGTALYGPDGTLYVDDYYNNLVDHYAPNGAFLSSFGLGQLTQPQAMTFGPDGNLYVGDVASSVQRFSPSGAFLGTFVAPGSGGLSNTKGLVFGPDGNLYAASLNTNSVLRYDGKTGAFLGAFVPSGSGGLSWPEGIAFGPDGNLYVSSYGTNSVYRYRGSDGAFLGAFVSSGLLQPYGLGFDSAGNLDVVDEGNQRVNSYDGATGAYLQTLVNGLSTPNYLTPVAANLGQGNVIQGNFIGTDASGSGALPNGDGVVVSGLSANNLIGGTVPGAGNTIAHNTRTGVVLNGGSGTAIEGNVIFSNAVLGIDLGNDGVTANTGTKNPALPNAGMNFPVFTSATVSGTTLTVAGYVGTAPGQAAFADSRIEIYQADIAASPYGQGPVYLGFLTADAGGNFAGTLTVSGLGPGLKISGTATDTANNTSEFAANAVLKPGLLSGLSSTNLASSQNPSVYGQAVTLTATVSAVAPATGTPTGTVTFMDGATILGTVALSGGTATLTTSALAAGSHNITVSYSGDSAFASSTSTSLTQTVTPALLTVTANDANRPNGQANPSFSDTIMGFVNGDTVAVVSGSASLTTTATASSPVGSYAITAALGSLSATNYTFSFANGTLTITAAGLLSTKTTVVSSSNPSEYGQAVTFNATVLSVPLGIPPVTGTVTFLDGVTPLGTVSLFPILSGGTASFTTSLLSAGSHSITVIYNGDVLFAGSTSTSLTQIVKPALLTVTANAAGKVYGQANPAFSDTLSGFVNGDTSAVVSGSASLTTTATASSGVGNYAISAALGSLSAANYTFAFVNGTLSITPAALTVTATDASKVYGQANPAFAVSYSGFVNGDSAATLGGALTFSTPATAASPAGSYAVTPSGLTAANYSLSFVAGSLTVTPATLTVSANNATKVQGQANPAFTASYSGFVNGDTASALGGTLSFTTPATAASPLGTYPVTPSGLTSGNYSISFLNGSLTVTAVPLTASNTAVVSSQNPSVYGQAVTLTATVTPVAPATGTPTGTVTFLDGATVLGTAPLSGGTATLTTSALVAGSHNITVSYSGDSAFASSTSTSLTQTVTRAVLTMRAVNAGKVYGQANPAFSDTLSGFVNGDTSAVVNGSASLTTTATASSGVGNYAISAALGSLSAANYTFAFVNGTLTVMAAIASPSSDQANPASTASSNAVVSGNNAGPQVVPKLPLQVFGLSSGIATSAGASSLDATLGFNPLATPHRSAGTSALNPVGLTANYTFTALNTGLSNLEVASPDGVPAEVAQEEPRPPAKKQGPQPLVALPAPAAESDLPSPPAFPPTDRDPVKRRDNPPRTSPTAWSTLPVTEVSHGSGVWSLITSGALLAAGYVILSSRTSLWLLSVLTGQPLLWRRFDPVEVLFAWEKEQKRQQPGQQEEEETLQSIVQ